MRAFLVLVRMRVNDVLRSPSSASYFLAAPVIILVVIAIVFVNGQPFERRHVGVVDAEPPPLAAYPEVALEPTPSEAAAVLRIQRRVLTAALVRAPSGWTVIVGDREGLFGRGLAAALPAPAQVRVVALPRWSYVHYVFPGVLTFAVLVSGLYGMGHAMARYRQSLFLKKLATTPLRKTTFIAAQVAARAILVFLQMVLLVAAAALLLDLPVSPWGLAALTVVTTVGLVTFMGVGFALACVIRNDALLADVINGLLSPLVLCSDMFFPVSALPRPLAVVAGALPTTQLVRAVRAILLHGVHEVGPLLPELGLLLVWLVATYAVSLRVFRWHDT